MSYEKRVRGYFTIVEEGSEKKLGTFFNDEGVQVLTDQGIMELLPNLADKPLRISKINWKNYDEVIVSLQIGSDIKITSAPGTPAAADSLPSGIRYLIYDMKNGEKLGTFVTDAANSILDKMILHKMFPQFELKSLRIVSLNWTDGGEVRVYIRGKKNPANNI